MEQTPFKKLLTFKKERRPSCTLCSNHGVHSNLKGHKHQCPFLTCHCELCVKGRRKRDIMKQQVRLRRKQMKEIGSRPYIVSPPRTGRDDFPGNSSVNVEPCSIENNNSPSYEDTRPFPKLGSLNGGLIQNVSSILHSPFVPRRQPFNCSAYIPTPFQLWTIGDGRVVAGVHYNNTAEHLKSSRPVENMSTSGFSVSDNSAFVKYCGQPSRFDEVSFRLGRTSSSEAAAVLASFANSECAAASK